jgi:hypothetical protein
MKTDDKVFLVSREYSNGPIMVNKFDSIDKAIKFKDQWTDLNEWHIDYHTLETTTLVFTVSEMIDLLDKYEKNTFDLIKQKGIESERKWKALGAFNKIRDEWVDESKYVVPGLTMFVLIAFFEGVMEATNEYIAGALWVGGSYALYRVQKFFIYRKTRGVFADFND